MWLISLSFGGRLIQALGAAYVPEGDVVPGEAVIDLSKTNSVVTLELIKFYSPSDEKGIHQASANTLGIRHIAFAVENMYKLCYVRGPEGII